MKTVREERLERLGRLGLTIGDFQDFEAAVSFEDYPGARRVLGVMLHLLTPEMSSVSGSLTDVRALLAEALR